MPIVTLVPDGRNHPLPDADAIATGRELVATGALALRRTGDLFLLRILAQQATQAGLSVLGTQLSFTIGFVSLKGVW